MKTRLIMLLSIVAIFIPTVSLSVPVPFFDITIIKNSSGADGVFDFNVSGPFDSENIDIETENGEGVGFASMMVNPGDDVRIAENQQPGWQYGGVSCFSDDAGVTTQTTIDGVIIKAYPFSSTTCVFINIKQTEKTPVLIVPGLLGTEMKRGYELLWADIVRMINPLNNDSFMDPLQFNTNLLPSDVNVQHDEVIKKKTTIIGENEVTLFDYTDGLITEFIGQGYVENETLFTFPYDWRYGVSGVYEDGRTNVDLLKQRIDDILQQTGADEVDVVAHSLGGLIVKKYAMDNPTDNHIGRAVFVGVPNTGAPKAVKVLLQGDNFGVLGLNDSEIKKISENMPATYDLLPSQEYYNVKGDSFIRVVDRTGLFGATVKELNYQESKSFLTDDHSLNSVAMSNAENLHAQTFDDFDLRTADIDLYAINGCKAGTLGKITEVRFRDIFGNEHITYEKPKKVPGDGTVPFESATNLPIDQQNKYYALSADHGKMPSQNGIRQQIVNIVSGSNLDTGRDIFGNDLITQNIDKCQLNGKAISVFSPINIFITDQSGNKLGLAEDQSIINEVPNADFEIWGEHKFVYLPTDNGQTYTINLQGTDTGIFTIKTDDIQNNQTTQTEVFSNFPVTENLTGQVIFSASAGQPTILLLDTDGNGTTDQSVEPSSVLDATQSDDLLPPISTAEIIGEQGQPGFYRSDVLINIAAEDENSGVLAIEYNLDGAGFQKIAGGTAGFTVSGEGVHTIIFFSTDRAGNNETEKIITFTIDKTPPEAIIEFNPETKDLKFVGQDSGLVTVADSDNVITLTDQAGNTTEIKLKEKDRKIRTKADIEEIKYNGISSHITKNSLVFVWLYDKKGNLKMISQHVRAEKEYAILAVYNGRNTKITGKDFSGKIRQTFTGLKIIKVATNMGDLGWSY